MFDHWRKATKTETNKLLRRHDMGGFVLPRIIPLGTLHLFNYPAARSAAMKTAYRSPIH